METMIRNVLLHYFDEQTTHSAVITQIHGGHINKSFKVETAEGTYLLQCLNGYVFKDLKGLMENLEKISNYLRKQVAARGGDVDRELVNIVYTKDGACSVPAGRDCWRITKFIDNAEIYEVIENPEVFEQCARAFGTFQNDLADFPAATLVETIPHFHDTPDRYRQFEEAMAANTAGRLGAVEEEVEFVKSHRPVCNKLTDLLHAGKLPLRVTHNDTKLSNILYDATTKLPICVIDLDTTMPGLVAYDFGDSIRGGAGTAAEDEQDISKVSVNLELFEAYTKGFLATVGTSLTETEKDTLPDGAILITLECGIRFLTDYLNGDVYFRTTYPEHNLVRARNMFKMVTFMEQNRDKLDAIIKKYK